MTEIEIILTVWVLSGAIPIQLMRPSLSLFTAVFLGFMTGPVIPLVVVIGFLYEKITGRTVGG